MVSDAEPGRAEPSRAEPSRAEQSRAEQSRAEQSRAEQSRAEQSRVGRRGYYCGGARREVVRRAGVFEGWVRCRGSGVALRCVAALFRALSCIALCCIALSCLALAG